MFGPWGLATIALNYAPRAANASELSFVQQDKADAPDLARCWMQTAPGSVVRASDGTVVRPRRGAPEGRSAAKRRRQLPSQAAGSTRRNGHGRPPPLPPTRRSTGHGTGIF